MRVILSFNFGLIPLALALAFMLPFSSSTSVEETKTLIELCHNLRPSSWVNAIDFTNCDDYFNFTDPCLRPQVTCSLAGITALYKICINLFYCIHWTAILMESLNTSASNSASMLRCSYIRLLSGGTVSLKYFLLLI